MRASDFRDGDIVEVFPKLYHDIQSISFHGVVDSISIPTEKRHADFDWIMRWVWVRQSGHHFSGGWYPSQCRLIERPVQDPSLPIPENITLGEN